MPPFKHFPEKPKRAHVLLTRETCDCDRTSDNCPVCDWGLGICSLCGMVEGELSELKDGQFIPTECPGKKPKPVKPRPCSLCDGTGRTRGNTKCPRCKGTGKESK